jgi:hypothetical protein
MEDKNEKERQKTIWIFRKEFFGDFERREAK